MFKATCEFVLGDKIVAEGTVLENASVRMIDLGLVVPFELLKTEETTVVREGKTKRTKKTDDGMVLLTEVSEPVETITTEE